jgi:hypothetical protein
MRLLRFNGASQGKVHQGGAVGRKNHQKGFEVFLQCLLSNNNKLKSKMFPIPFNGL